MGPRRRPARGRVPRARRGRGAALTPAGPSAPDLTLIWDGGCRLCRRAIEWVRARDADRRIADTPCGSEEQRARCPAIDEAACLRWVIAVRSDGAVFHAEHAVAETLRRLPGWRPAGALIAAPGLSLLAAAAYRLVAAGRRFL